MARILSISKQSRRVKGVLLQKAFVMKKIRTEPIKNISVQVPGSKSFTHRILIASALSDGVCRIDNPLRSEDTLLTASGLRQMGVDIEDHGPYMVVHGTGGVLKPATGEICLGNSGTSVRLLTGICAIGSGRYVITGTARMRERPVQDLLDGLQQLGVRAASITGNGCPPVEVFGQTIEGGMVNLDCHVSSQYLSSMLLMAPFSVKGIDINVVKGPVSRPYIEMTIEVMERLGVTVRREGYEKFFVPGGQTYRSGEYDVEPDCSQAGYFWAAAAVTGASVKVKGVDLETSQGDVRFAQVLGEMGCIVKDDSEGLTVTGGPLSGIDVDMSDMPDMVPTLAVAAAFARGTTVIRNVAHLKAKESDRLGSVVKELSKMGITAACDDNGMTITGGKAHGARIETYNDHRMAMSFAVAGLKVHDIYIENESCVSKSFPNFWEVFESLYE
jgi:3-phosphoshikimate 1-carboxyvinyltransferase